MQHLSLLTAGHKEMGRPRLHCPVAVLAPCHLRHKTLLLLVILGAVSVLAMMTLKSNLSGTEDHKFEQQTSKSKLDILKLPKAKPKVSEDNSRLDTSYFQRVNKHDTWLYSAYHDTHDDGRHLVRIFGLEDNTTKGQVYCHVTTDGQATLLVGRRVVLPDSHQKRFRSVLFECDLTVPQSRRPEQVALTFNEADTPANHLKVLYPQPRVRNFTVCFAALFNFRNPVQLVSSIEINRVLGAQHFYVYNFTVSKITDGVLRHYQKLGVLTVMQWSLPRLDTWYFAQMLAVNDCVYRNRNTSKYVVVQDTDEIIVPYRHDTWNDVIEVVDKEYYNTSETSGVDSKRRVDRPPVSTYIFETTVFYGKTQQQDEWEALKKNFSISRDEDAMLRRYSVVFFTHLRRLNTTLFKSHTKCIIRPEMVLVAGIHFTRSQRGVAIDKFVGSDLAIVHHYRWSPITSVVDVSVYKVKDRVFPILKEKFSELLERF